MKIRGFTLIELMVVVAILMLIVVGAVDWSRNLSRTSDVHSSPPSNPAPNPECRNGYLMNGAQAITDKNGAVVHC